MKKTSQNCRFLCPPVYWDILLLPCLLVCLLVSWFAPNFNNIHKKIAIAASNLIFGMTHHDTHFDG